MRFLIPFYVLTIAFFLSRPISFTQYYNNITETHREALEKLIYKYPDELFLLNMFLDR